VSDKRKRPGEAGRSGKAECDVRGGHTDNTNPFDLALARLPLSMRARYIANCLKTDTAYRHFEAGKRLLRSIR
jgi:hypothetical protein